MVEFLSFFQKYHCSKMFLIPRNQMRLHRVHFCSYFFSCWHSFFLLSVNRLFRILSRKAMGFLDERLWKEQLIDLVDHSVRRFIVPAEYLDLINP